MPMNQVSVATMTAIARLVAIVLAQGCQPLRMRPTGSLCCNEKQIGRSDPEHDQRVAVKTVFQTAPPRKGPVFAHCQRIDITDTTAVEVAAGGMMNCMRPAPTVVGREREHANDAADPVVRQAAGEKRAVAAVVLDHEQAYEKAGGRNRDKQ